MKKSKILCILISFLMIFILSSCEKQKNDCLTKVKLAEVTRSVFYTPQYVALSLSFFEKEGIDVSLATLEGSDKIMTAILSSGADIGLMGSEVAAYVSNERKNNLPVLFASLTKRDGSFLVGKDENFSWENLRGKSIIVGRKGSLPEMILEYILRKNNLEPGKDITLINNVKFDLMGGAFLTGIADYVTLFDPTATLFEENKNLKILRPLGLESGEITYTCYCASQNYINKNPKIIQLFTNSINKAQNWIKNHNAEEITEVIYPYFQNTNKSLLLKSIKRSMEIDLWCDSPIIKKESFEFMEEVAINAKELKNKVDFNKIVNNDYANKAIKGE